MLVCPGMRLQPSDPRTVFERAHRRGAGGNNTPAFEESLVDLPSRFRRQRISFLVEANLRHSGTRTGWNVPSPTWSVTWVTRTPRARIRCRIWGVKCSPAVGAATEPRLSRKNGLVPLAVERLVLPANVRRQRDMPQRSSRAKKSSTGMKRRRRSPNSPSPATVACNPLPSFAGPKASSCPTAILRAGRVSARHSHSPVCSVRSTSTLPVLPGRTPNSRAGITRLSFNTSTSPSRSNSGSR